MPRFRVTIEGSGIEVPGGFAGAPNETVRGFFVARVVHAATREEAGQRVLAAIRDDWSRGAHAGVKVKPTLRVSDVHPATFIEWLRPKRTGYAFHSGR